MILAIDTSTSVCSVALSDDDGKLIKQLSSLSAFNHAETLFKQVETIKKIKYFNFNKINKIACTTGPGSFTGIRIGLVCARTIAQVHNIPVFAISTLKLLACQAAIGINCGTKPILICPLITCNKEEVFTAIYSLSKSGELTPLLKDSVMGICNLKKLINRYKDSQFYFAGDFCNAFPDASYLCTLASKSKGKDYHQIKPTYIKSPRLY